MQKYKEKLLLTYVVIDEYRLVAKVFIILSYFDDIFGPQIIEVYPEADKVGSNQFHEIVNLLMDLPTRRDDTEWTFIYADRSFCSQNQRLSIVNQQARGGLSDLLITVVCIPFHGSILGAMGYNWEALFDIENAINEHTNLLQVFEISELMRENLHELLKDIIIDVREHIQSIVDILEPDSFKIQ